MRRQAHTAWDVGSTVVVVAAAVTMLVFYLKDRKPPPDFHGSAVAAITDWRGWEESAVRSGPEQAPMVVAAFMDFECPFCRDLAAVLDSLSARLPGKVAFEFHHFPLNGHRFATKAAMAAECALRQGRFDDMRRALFARMDSLDSEDWVALAVDAGVPDLPAFQTCMQRPLGEFARIFAGRSLGKRLGVAGTPTVWINGRLFRGRTLESFREEARSLGL
jgi:protein-disulfide isomerase